MTKLCEKKLLAGYIYGDTETDEYIYLPGSELDTEHPIAVYEKDRQREDIPLPDAVLLVERRSLRLVKHPFFGERSI